ncbi:hypothetical protein [uncultured Serinicoccus sp.]|uniref:hypothetical protein n=1 Tax=uncultured Serinicoccus sp. TaxID=735514 RepID=UPI00262B09D6|nr:hypothetical protein [uncultured Serinicoccus sp.]
MSGSRLSVRPPQALQSWRLVVSWVFYGGLSLCLLAIVLGLPAQVLPEAIASTFAYNSEGYFFALLLGAWIHFALPRLPRGSHRLMVASGVGLAFAVLGWWMLSTEGLRSSIATLNEPALALAVLVPYVTLSRPLARWAPVGVSVVVLITVALGLWAGDPQPGVQLESVNWVISMAEMMALVFLAPIVLDLTCPWILDRSERGRSGVLPTLLGLALVPVIVSGLGQEARAGDSVLPLMLNYLGRSHEAFVGFLLLVAYFGLLQRRRDVD